MRIDFEETTHTYFVNSDIASVSVTELLAKHGLSPDYSGVSKATLKAKANRGTEIHKDLENVLNQKGYQPTTQQGEDFDKWVIENVDCGVGEQMLAYEYNGMTICGTCDVMGIMKDGTLFIGDHKTTSDLHKESVAWQVSLLDYFARHLNGESVNEKSIFWVGAKKFYCFWYSKEEEMKVVELEKIEDTEIEKLIDCEYHNEIYQRPTLAINEDLQLAVEQAETLLAEINAKQKEAELSAKILREALMKQMQHQGIKTWETDKVRVTYIEPQDRISVDSTRLKQMYPMVYSDCQKLTQVKPTVRITIKGAEDDL